MNQQNPPLNAPAVPGPPMAAANQAPQLVVSGGAQHAMAAPAPMIQLQQPVAQAGVVHQQQAHASAGGVALLAAAAVRPPPSEFVREGRKPEKKAFEEALKSMMYGFGDDEIPLPETLSLVNDIVGDFVTSLTRSSISLSQRRGKGKKIAIEDLLFLVRKHPKMYFRAKELLKKDKEIEQAKQVRQNADKPDF